MSRILLYVIFLLSYVHFAYAVDKIKIIGLFKNKAVIQLDGKQRLLLHGMTSPEGVTLISADSNEAILEINGVRNIFTIGTHIGSSFKSPTGKKTVFIAPDRQGMYWISGSINEFQVKFVVDTGASLISMNKHQAKRIGLDYKMLGKKSVSSTASGLVKIYIINLKKVKIGDIELRNVKAAVHDGDFPQVILLGNSFLAGVDMKREGGILELHKKY